MQLNNKYVLFIYFEMFLSYSNFSRLYSATCMFLFHCTVMHVENVGAISNVGIMHWFHFVVLC